MSDEKFDVVIIGGGPGGTTCAIELAQFGLSSVIIERESFPRFHIGESLTGYAGSILRRLGLADKLNEQQFPIKPGVTVIGKDAQNEFFVPVLHPTWQVRRSVFDSILLDKAREFGAEYRQGHVTSTVNEGETVTGIRYRPAGQESEATIHSRVVVDASGHRQFLSKLGVAGKRTIDLFDKQVAIFTHFENLRRDPPPFANNTTILYSKKYHWSWIIPISPTVDSLGIVIPVELYRESFKRPEEALEWGIKFINPEIAPRCVGATMVEEVRTCTDYSYRIDPFIGEGWLCIGDAHRFLDPIFSFGVSFAMTEAVEAAKAIKRAWAAPTMIPEFEKYRDFSDAGQNIAADLIRYFWKFPLFFGYQMQNPDLRQEVIELFGGAVFDSTGMRVPELFRAALAEDDAAAARPRASSVN